MLRLGDSGSNFPKIERTGKRELCNGKWCSVVNAPCHSRFSKRTLVEITIIFQPIVHLQLSCHAGCLASGNRLKRTAWFYHLKEKSSLSYFKFDIACVR